MKGEINREAWLTKVAMEIEKYVFAVVKGSVSELLVEFPPYRVSCGWPSKRRACGVDRLAECHSPQASAGKYYEIFISPAISDGLQVAGLLCHELVHVSVGVEVGHGKKFVELSKKVGLLRGKGSTAMPNDGLENVLLDIIGRVGEYPHYAISLQSNVKSRIGVS